MVIRGAPQAVHAAVFSAECDRCSWRIVDIYDPDQVKNRAQAHADRLRHEVQICMAIPKMFYDVVRPSDGRAR